MRAVLVALIVPLALSGCATGHAKDWFRDRTNIINPQLLRYGMDVPQARCVSERLGKRLSRAELGKLQRRAEAVGRGQQGRSLTPAALKSVAAGLGVAETRLELEGALTACGVADRPMPVLAADTPDAGGSGAPIDIGALPSTSMSTAATWLNLGAAETGQAIAIDAASIQQDGETRTAWFRMTDPDSGGPSTNNYRLRIDCQAKTVQPLALRQNDASGAQTSLREYTPEEAKAGAAESGTVLEIAFISLCT